jgi:regulator of protease activity HflC (stomatin/prohibitin superfamily)
VRTADDALLTVRLMIFYKLESVEAMMDATNDPIADIINSVSSDVIGFCSARSFEQFKETSEQLNTLGAYQNLVESVKTRGFSVSKVVFRGYMAPQRLQKMHDEAIEKRTKLVLERESEVQEQRLADERLAKDAERAQARRTMEKAHAAHEAEMKRTTFEAQQRELREAAELETTLEQQRQESELKHLAAMQGTVGLGSGDMLNLLVAREHGPPAKLIQIAGDCKPFVSVADASDGGADGSPHGGKGGKGVFRRAPSPGRLFTK